MARGIFHTNGVKCHVNKLRAEQWARQQWASHLLCSGYGQGIITSFAREARHRPRQSHMAATQRC